MIRRTFLKVLMASPLGFLIPVPISSGHFWMFTFGPHYNPKAIDPQWNTIASSLLGVYSGEVLIGVKASERACGDVIVLNDGRRYLCFELDNSTYMKSGNLGIFLR